MKDTNLCSAAQNCHRRSFKQHGVRFIILALLYCSSLITPQPAAAGEETIRIAITPCTDIIKTFKIFQPLATYLQDKIKRPVRLIIPKDFYEFEAFVQQKKADFTYQAPHTYVRLAHLYNRETLLKSLTPKGEAGHRGVVIVRRDSPITTIADLKGRVVMFGSELSTAKSIATKILLRENDIDIDRDLKHYVHDGSCESIALNIFLKEADAGAICDYSFENINEPGEQTGDDIPAGQFRVLAETMEIPTWVFSALRQTDSEVIFLVSSALQELDSEKEQFRHILEAAEIGGFVPARDSDYDQVRQLAKDFQ